MKAKKKGNKTGHKQERKKAYARARQIKTQLPDSPKEDLQKKRGFTTAKKSHLLSASERST